MEKKRKRVSLGATPKKGSTSTSNKRGASGKTKKNGLSGNGEESSVHQGSVYRNKKGAVANNNNNNSSRWNVNEDRETFSVGNANPNIQR